jgi:hypothetical protein
MQNDLTSRTSHELYVIEIDGIKQSGHQVFIEALKRGLELKGQYPRSDIKLRDANNNASRDGHPSRTEPGTSVGQASGSELRSPRTFVAPNAA